MPERKPGSYIKDKGKTKPNLNDEAMAARAGQGGKKDAQK